MKLHHEFTIPLSRPDAWSALLDISRVAQSFPGATLETVTGDEFAGAVRLKLGPILMTYEGTATFAEKDESSYTLKVDAAGRDKRGAGTARALVTANLSEEDTRSTQVSLETDLAITGKPAQFGRGVIEEVSNNILEQFAENLKASLTGSDGGHVGEASGDAERKRSEHPAAPLPDADQASLDVLSPALLVPLAKRILPALAAAGAGLLLMRVMTRSRRAQSPPIIYIDLRSNRQSPGVPVVDRQ